MDEHGAATTALGLYHSGEDRSFVLLLNKEARAELLGGSQPEIMQELDVVILSDLLLDGLLGLAPQKCVDEGRINYFSDPDEALDAAVKESSAGNMTPLVFLMNATRVHQVRDVADNGLVMPHKSTYFYPKILTGLVMNKLIAGERITVP